MSLATEHLHQNFRRLTSDRYGLFRGMHALELESSAPSVLLTYLEGPDRIRHTGAGLNEADSVNSCFGEAVERYCAVHPRVDLVGSYNLLSKNRKLFNPADYILSPHQKFSPDEELSWVQSDRGVYLPQAYVYLIENELFAATSTGLACHESFEKAREYGAYELIERDAFCKAWWLEESPPQIELDKINDDQFSKIKKRMKDHFTKVTAFYIESHLPVVVCAYRGDGKNHAAFCVTAACRPNPMEALNKALVELMHSIALVLPEDLFPEASSIDEITQVAFEETVQSFDEHIDLYSVKKFSGATDFLFESKERVNIQSLATKEEFDLDVYSVDITTRDIEAVGLKVVRSFAPGLIPMNGAHKMRPINHPRLNANLNPLPHPFP